MLQLWEYVNQMLAGGNVCAPTRCALMTGQHTGHTAVRFNRGDLALRADNVTIAEMLKAEGYATGGFGKWGLGDDHLGYFPDVMPTLAELTGAKSGSDIDGISIGPTLHGEAGRKQAQHEYLYWEDLKSCAVRMGSWKAVRPDKDGPFELYDLSADVEELNDVAAQYPDILEKMMQYAGDAHTPIREGEILDPSMGFKGHDED